MAVFKAFLPNGKITQFDGINADGSGTLSGDELLACMESKNHSAILVITEEDGSIVLVDDRDFKIKPPQNKT